MRIELCREYRAAGAFATALSGRQTGQPPVRLTGLATDSAEIEKGDIFLALPGKTHNGWEYLDAALQRGAAGAILPHAAGENPHVPYRILVDDPFKSLLAAAAAHRAHLNGTVIAVSGSAGKTTAKEAIATVLGERGVVRKSRGNYNSSIGLPLSLLSMDEADFYVLEIGISHPGEMEEMSLALAPEIAVLTNIGSAHIGNFGSFEALAAEKRKIASGIRQGGTLLLPENCQYPPIRDEKIKIFRFGCGMNCAFRAENIRMDAQGVTLTFCHGGERVPFLHWGIPGEMGVSTLLIAGAVARLCRVGAESLSSGIARAAAFTPRMRRIAAGGRLLLNDAYNASPETVAAALKTLSYLAGKRQSAAVLGDMEELGAFSVPLHEAVGECAGRSGISLLFTYGKKALDIAGAAVCAGMPRGAVFSFLPGEERELAGAILKKTKYDAVILFKASRKARMEEIVRAVERKTQ